MADDDRPDDFDDGDTGSTGRRSRPDPDRDITDLGDVGENPSFFDDPEPEIDTRPAPDDFGFDDIDRDDDPAPRRSLRPGRSRAGGARSGTRVARPVRSRGSGGASRARAAAGAGGLNLQNRMVRIGLGVLFAAILIFVLALVVQDCRRDAQVDSYKRYTNDAVTISQESQEQGKLLLGILANRQRNNAAELQTAVRDLAAKADGLAQRADDLSPPDKMRDADAGLLTSLRLRATNLSLLAEDIPKIIQTRNRDNASALVAARMARFFTSDVLYRDLFVAPARAALVDDDITGIEVPDTALFLPGTTVNYVTNAGAGQVVNTIKNDSGGTGTDAGGTGLRGNSLVKTAALPSGDPLSTDSTTDLSSELTGWQVTVENGGDFDETNVTVTATLSYPDKPDVVKETVIEAINSGETLEVTIPGPAADEQELGVAGNLRIEVQQVSQERNTDNNVAEYPVKIVFR